MNTNLPQLLLTAGLSVGMISIPSIAEARLALNGSSLTGEKTKKQQQSKALSMNGSSLTGEKTKKQQQSKALTMKGSSLTGQSSQQ